MADPINMNDIPGLCDRFIEKISVDTINMHDIPDLCDRSIEKISVDPSPDYDYAYVDITFPQSEVIPVCVGMSMACYEHTTNKWSIKLAEQISKDKKKK